MSTKQVSPTAELESCPCAGASLDRLIQPAILTILAEGSLHGYKIVQRIADLERYTPDVTGVYRSLRAMEKRGLVVSSWDISDTGPAKRSYTLTDAGEECLDRWIGTLEKHREAIARLLAQARKASARARHRPSRKCCSKA
jgi:PadR family transcriptional regulator PadR